MTRNLLIDTDGGVDDSLALLLALSVANASVEAITTVAGNVSLDQVNRNVATVLQFVSPSLRPAIHPGAAAPLDGPLPMAEQVHGKDGLGNVTLPHVDGSPPRYAAPFPRLDPMRADAVLSAFLREPGKSVAVLIGPATNLAEALNLSRVSGDREYDIVVLGGAFETAGNITETAEFNIFVDPLAFHALLQSGIKPKIIPLDICRRYAITPEMLRENAERSGNAMAIFIDQIHRTYFESHRSMEGINGCYPHDSISVAAAIEPEMFTFEPRCVVVDTTSSMTRGQTSFGNGGANCLVAVDLDVDAFDVFLRAHILTGAKESRALTKS